MSPPAVNVADAKKHLSELLGRVAYGKEEIVITKRGKPMARLVPAEENAAHLGDAKGWLDEKDDFFATIDRIVKSRSTHAPRVLRSSRKGR
jgi:prevent-host-death family protein